jgi:hypothetical protein
MPLYPKNNLWEYFLTTSGDSLQKEFLQTSVIQNIFDPSISPHIGFNSDGEPVYDSMWINRNMFLYSINDISKEDSVYTVFVLTDNAFQSEYNKIKPYLNDTTASSTTIMNYNAKWDVCKDIVVRGKYTQDKLPKILVSTQGISIPTDSLQIISSYEASNGIIYVVDRFNIPLANKITTITIEGENYSNTYDGTFTSATIALLGIRIRSWASGGADLYIPGGSNGHRTPWLSIRYNTPKLYTVTYNVYWRAVNDFQGSSFIQKLAINADSIKAIKAKTYQGDTLVRYKTILPNNYSEVLLGQFTNMRYGSSRLFVAADSTITNDPVVLDYLKLVPVF